MNLIIHSTGKKPPRNTVRKLIASGLVAGFTAISFTTATDAKIRPEAVDNASPAKEVSVSERHDCNSRETTTTPADRCEHHDGAEAPPRIASELPLSAPMILPQDPLPKPSKKLLSAVLETTIRAPLPFVWQKLTDFSDYPQIFPRIESCKVTKRVGNYVYTESNLKPQLFLRESTQKVVNDLTGKPHVLRWAMLQGNFENSQGCWELTPEENGKSCKIKYTLESTTEPVPRAIASFTLKFVQKDIVKTFKRSTERLYQGKAESRNVAVSP